MLATIRLAALSFGLMVLLTPSTFSQTAEEWKADFIQDSLLGLKYAEISNARYLEVDTCMYYGELALDKLCSTSQWVEYVGILTGLSYCYNIKEDFDKLEQNNFLAFRIAQEHLPIDHHYYMAALSNLAFVYDEVYEDHKTSIALYRDALQLARQYQKGNYQEGVVLENIGQRYHRLGDLETSISYYQEALNKYFHLDAIPFFRLAKIYNKIARLKADQGLIKEALVNEEKAISLVEASVDSDPSYLVRFVTQLARLRLENEEPEQALLELDKIASLEWSRLQEAKILHLKGDIFLSLGRRAAAQSALRAALRVLPSKEPILSSAIQLSLGKAIPQEQITRKLEVYHRAMAVLFPDTTVFAENGLPPLTARSVSRVSLGRVLRESAQLLEELNTDESLQQALDVYRYLGIQIDQARRNYQSEESRLLLVEHSKEIGEQAIDLAFRLYIQSGHKPYLESAFYFAEQSKAKVLYDELSRKILKDKSPSVLQKQEEEYTLRVAIAQLYIDKVNIQDTLALQQMDQHIFVLEDSLTKLKEIAQPDYYQVQDPVRVADIQQELLKPRQALIEYFMGSKWLYTFVLEQDDFRVRRDSLDGSVRHHLRELLQLTKMTGSDGVSRFERASFALYQKLWQPSGISDKITSIILVPDGPLAYLPFDMLVSELRHSVFPAELAYLIHRYTFSYAYSASILIQQHTQLSAQNGMLGVYPIFADTRQYLAASEEEYHYLQKFAGKHLPNQEARLNSFLQLAGDYHVLHLSTHARALDSSMQEPSIDFYDKAFYLSSLTARQLNANMVVLSACETGLGTNRKGEGVMSLARGFSYAGVPSVITSMWAVPERSTSAIIQQFYDQLAKQVPKDQALRRAKLAFLQQCTDAEAAPYFWNAFVAIGNCQPITIKKAPSKKWKWWLFSAGFLGLIFWAKARKK